MPRDNLALIYIGRELFNNEAQKSYIKREVDSFGYRVDVEISKEIFHPEILESTLQLFPNINILICASNDKTALVGRVLSRFLNDSLTVDEETLLPLHLKSRDKFSYLVDHFGSKINVLSIKSGRKLPKILLTPPVQKTYIVLFEEDEISKFKSWAWRNPKVTTLHKVGRYHKIRVNSKREIFSFKNFMRKLNLKIVEKDSLVEAIIEYLTAKNLKITFAESCTGGALANRFISHSGTSAIIDGAMITYSNNIKSSWLGVEEETLIDFGAVSEETVWEMARGARAKVGADIAIAVSGIAGPTGAVEGKPVGTVYICVDIGGEQRTRRLNLTGDRVYIQQRSVDWAIFMLLEALEEDFFNFFAKNP